MAHRMDLSHLLAGGQSSCFDRTPRNPFARPIATQYISRCCNYSSLDDLEDCGSIKVCYSKVITLDFQPRLMQPRCPWMANSRSRASVKWLESHQRSRNAVDKASQPEQACSAGPYFLQKTQSF